MADSRRIFLSPPHHQRQKVSPELKAFTRYKKASYRDKKATEKSYRCFLIRGYIWRAR